MPKPTLLTPGAIVIQKWMNPVEKRQAKHEISLEFIMDFIGDRVPVHRNKEPKIKPKGMGDKVIVLKSGTGSGKSTTIPPRIYERFFDALGKNIAVTQPRILTAVDVPLTILPYNPNLKLGINIGYQTGSIIKKPVKGIIFMTVGILLQQLKILTDEEFMNKYMFILIDEVHERDVNVDLVLLYMKKLLERNYGDPNCPMLILMSATFEKEELMKYFRVPNMNYIEVTGGRTFRKDIYYEENPVVDWMERIIELVKMIHFSPDGLKDAGISIINNKYIQNGRGSNFRDILIFVSSKRSILKVILELQKLNTDSDFNRAGYILPIRLDSDSYKEGGKEYQNLFAPVDQIQMNVPDKKIKISRKVIIATNVAETGITIESLKYCIDTGFVISVEFNPIYSIRTIITKNVTQGMSEQRAGRVGRVSPGVVYLLYTKKTYDMFIKDQYPQLVTNDITSNLLGTIIAMTNSIFIETSTDSKDGIFMNLQGTKFKVGYDKPFGVLMLDFLTYPSSDSIQYSIEKLYMLGFITQIKSTLAPVKEKNNGEIIPTVMGLLANKIRKMKIENIRMIFAGYSFGCNILDLITIAIFLEGQWSDISSESRIDFKSLNPLDIENEEEIELYQKIIFADDFIEYLWIWLLFMKRLDEEKSKKKINMENIKKWAIENNLKYRGLINKVAERDELMETFISLGFNPFWNGLNLKRGTYNLIDITKHDLNTGIREIQKIKKCIYEGYKLNMATYNRELKKYVMNFKKIPIDILNTKLVQPLFLYDIEQPRPRNIIIANIILTKITTYNFAADTISVVDGFLPNIDMGIINSYP